MAAFGPCAGDKIKIICSFYHGETAMLDELEYAVRYRRISGNSDRGWHTMAAFDSEAVANYYAANCRREDTSKASEFRVFKIKED
jgi:hypothetical protein